MIPPIQLTFIEFAKYIIIKATEILLKTSLYFLFLFCTNVYAACPSGVCYVRPDGGNTTQCTGGTDAAYDGSGSGEACALKHPYYAFGWYKYGTVATPTGGQAGIVAGGDDVIIKTSTAYKMGYSTTEFACDSGASYDCVMRRIPSGSSGNPTRIFGCSTTGCTAESQYPELWSSGRTYWQWDLRGKSWIEMGWLNITDRAACGEGHATLSCGAVDANELSGRDGIIWTGGSNITLKNINIHGMRSVGITGRCANCSILGKSNIRFNAMAGINMDTCNNDGTCGLSSGQTFTIQGDDPDNLVHIDWNGCVENPDSIGNPMTVGCYNGNNGGYGEGLGSSTTSGTFNIKYASFSHNTSDGLDLKYCTNTGCSITVDRSIFAGNSGNQIKTTDGAFIRSSLIECNCDFFNGKSYSLANIDRCQSLGDCWNQNFSDSGATAKFYSNTVVDASGNVFVSVVPRGTCSNETVDIRDSVIVSNGRYSGLGGGSSGWSFIDSACSNTSVTVINSNIDGFSSDPSGTGNNFNPPVLSGAEDVIDSAVYLTGSSPAVNLSGEAVTDGTSNDYNNFARGAAWDSGALENGSSFSGTPPLCGNDVLEGIEFCDTNQLNSQTCVTLGYASGTLACNGTCTAYDTSACVTSPCGNGNIDGTEQCDGVNLNGQTCASQGYSSCAGTLGCTACALTQGTCTTITCGDGCLDGAACDDSNTANSDGCSSLCETEVVGLEKFLLYTETDTPGTMSVFTHKVQMNGITHAADSSVRKDFGAGYFGDFVHRFKVQIDSCSDNGAGEDGGAMVWALAAASYGDATEMDTADDGIALQVQCFSSVARNTWRLIEYE